MAGYKNPDFNERIAAARAARQSMLDKLQNKPAPDPGVIAERQAVRAARDAAAAQRRADRKRAADEAKAARSATQTPHPGGTGSGGEVQGSAAPSEAGLKAARDARYAARKARKR